MNDYEVVKEVKEDGTEIVTVIHKTPTKDKKSTPLPSKKHDN